MPQRHLHAVQHIRRHECALAVCIRPLANCCYRIYLLPQTTVGVPCCRG